MAISKVVLHDDSGADRTLVDLTGDTVAPETLMEGATAHDKAGNPIKGTAKPGSGGKQVQSDWAENDPQSPAYVKNRPGGYDDELIREVMAETSLEFSNQDGLNIAYAQYPGTEWVLGETYIVKWDGTDYQCVALYDVDNFESTQIGLGNLKAFGGADTGEPFLLMLDGGSVLLAFAYMSNSHTFSINGMTKAPVKIPEKYLPTPPDSLPPIAPDDESAFLQVTGGKAAWSKLAVRSEKAPDEWTDGEWTKYGAVYDAGGSVECLDILGALSRVLYLNATDKSALVVDGNVSHFYSHGFFKEQFAFSGNEVQNTAILAIEDGPNERGPMKRLKIKSSTPGSAKEFYITVDDTGTIKATEVV